MQHCFVAKIVRLRTSATTGVGILANSVANSRFRLRPTSCASWSSTGVKVSYIVVAFSDV